MFSTRHSPAEIFWGRATVDTLLSRHLGEIVVSATTVGHSTYSRLPTGTFVSTAPVGIEATVKQAVLNASCTIVHSMIMSHF